MLFVYFNETVCASVSLINNHMIKTVDTFRLSEGTK